MSLNLVLAYESSALAAPQSFRNGMQAAANILDSLIQDNITVTIQVGYGDWDNGQDTGITTGAEGGDLNGLNVSYTSLRSALASHETSAVDQTFVNSLPNTSTVNGVSSLWVPSAVGKALGLMSPNGGAVDGAVGMGTQIPSNLLVGVALHELTHAMGREPWGGTFDLFRYTSPGNHLFTTSGTAVPAYFSIDGGNTKLADFGQSSDSSDFLNSGVQGSTDSFNEFYSYNTLQSLTPVDIQLLDALGFDTTAQGITVSATASQAIQGGAAVALLSGPPSISDSAHTTLSSATIKIANGSGSAVTGDELYVNGQQSGTVDGGLVTVNWNDSTKVLTLTGTVSIGSYQTLLSEISYQDAGTDVSVGSHPRHTVTWTVNDGTTNLSTTSQIAIERPPSVTLANVALNTGYLSVAASSLFTASDPDNDAIATYAVKDTGNGYFVLNGVAQAHNQEIDVTAGQLSQLTYQNATGTDTLQVRVNDGTLWSNWASFTVTGPVVTVIEANGSTSLTEVGSQFYLYNGGGVGPSLKYLGVIYVAGQSGGWAPISAEQTSSGYEVAWKLAGADEYTVWTTDSNGNFINNIGAVSGTSGALESLESSFHQDLNGDGVIGLVSTVIEANGSTSLLEAGSNFYLDTGGSGPSLKYLGVDYVAGQSGGWAPISAEQTAGGYEVAWKLAGADEYTVWTTDSNGNFISNIGAVSGTSHALESLEPSFHQDLNGDGVIGFVSTVIEANGSTSLVEAGSNFYLDTGGSGPSLKYLGLDYVAGQSGGWAPISAEQTAGGYEVAWKLAGADEYTVWTTDSNGNFITNIGAVSGTSSALESLESIFHQDLNGDGVTGLAVAAGATLELNSAHSDAVTFTSSTGTLKLDNPSTFTGHLIGFTGDGTLSGSDQIDLLNMNYSGSIQSDSTYGPSTGTLTVSNGTTVDVLNFVGSYSQANFKFASDGHGGTIVYDPPTASQVSISAGAGQDNFVFAPNFGRATLSHFTPGTDTLQIDHTVFAGMDALLAAIHDDQHGNAVITDAAHDTITIQNVTTAQLLAHQGGFHLV
jgi:20S proteasome alpha/beta subunit